MSLFPIYQFTSGSDSTAHEGNPRRFKISDSPAPSGWVPVFQFQAYRTQMPGTVPIYVSQSGGGATSPGGNPHRFRVSWDSGNPSGWQDTLVFHAHNQPAAGTSPLYVMERGGGNPAAGNPHRCEVTTDPVPAPGWTVRLTFHAFPLADPNVVTMHVFIAGDDRRAHEGEPRRAQITRDGVGPAQCGWTKTLEFKTYLENVDGTYPPTNKYFVSECGGGPTYPGCNPHRFRVHLDSGVPSGWTRDTMHFHAQTTAVRGRVPFYVMERGGGNPAAGDPSRCEVTLDPVPAAGWAVKSTFYAWPSYNPQLRKIYVYQAGDDSRASQGEPRRFNISLDGVGPGNAGWTRVMEFLAHLEPVTGASQIFVSEAGGGPTHPGCNPHRFRVGLETGVPTGWTRDVFTFYAYINKTSGAAPFYVMERGGGDPARGDPSRCEITQNPVPAPLWHLKLQFYAYPLPAYV